MDDKLIIGRKPILDALKAHTQIEKVWIDSKMKGDVEKEVRFLTRQQKIPLQYVPKEKLTSLASKGMHQGVVAQLAIVDYLTIEDVVPHIFEKGRNAAILVLDGIEDVRNIGALSRSAVWFDFDAIVVSLKKSARINSFAYKSSAGAIKDIPICREVSLVKALEYIKSCGIQLVVADMDGEAIKETDFHEPTALILGSEGKGVVREVRALADKTISIPGSGRVESLNVSVAGAILMYDFYRIRNSKL